MSFILQLINSYLNSLAVQAQAYSSAYDLYSTAAVNRAYIDKNMGDGLSLFVGLFIALVFIVSFSGKGFK